MAYSIVTSLSPHMVTATSMHRPLGWQMEPLQLLPDIGFAISRLDVSDSGYQFFAIASARFAPAPATIFVAKGYKSEGLVDDLTGLGRIDTIVEPHRTLVWYLMQSYGNKAIILAEYGVPSGLPIHKIVAHYCE